MAAVETRGWGDPDQVAWYLERMDRLEARRAGERALLEAVANAPATVLDLGCGDGRLGRLVAEANPCVRTVLGVDRSPAMLDRARRHVGSVFQAMALDLGHPLPDLGTFDAVVSGFAIHHLEDARKRALFAEVTRLLAPGGVFANLEVVASSTPARHAEFLAAIGRTEDDPEDRLAPVEFQVAWMTAAGLEDVECLWRWRGFAVLAGVRPGGPAEDPSAG